MGETTEPITRVTNADLSQELTMAMTSRDANRIKDEMNVAFAQIGKGKLKRLKDNIEPYVWEYYIAQHLRSMAEARFKQAKSAVIAVGAIPDPEKSPRPAGTDEMCYTGNNVQVKLTVNQPSYKVDPTKLIEYLGEKGVRQKWLTEAQAYAEVEMRPAHVFKADIKID